MWDLRIKVLELGDVQQRASSHEGSKPGRGREKALNPEIQRGTFENQMPMSFSRLLGPSNVLEAIQGIFDILEYGSA